MTIPNMFSRTATPARRDHSAAAIVIMMVLVFAPVIGMHVAAVAFDSDAASATNSWAADGLATLLRLGHGSPG
ncbi:hypothetical protein [Methylobacterium oxalidis]|uniref:Uncharacterized protein n=1 Tax=Methylobacterium oxalidis TaxID=944322 RepID=A0A512JD40_9HYPH|nr:hypothetical protein [Methylobacterium oxalidis]GEP07859.1 hypothetical protein MOX02_58970 [Methylobacterium oxalidis]GJE34652.1 hypothetical protein LDDCCGHA_4864 [Methylobacterium oxalidis]GLS65774.1 hypothetical protein GCM10007888_41560 [Methylobacterium oxalidis]